MGGDPSYPGRDPGSWVVVDLETKRSNLFRFFYWSLITNNLEHRGSVFSVTLWECKMKIQQNKIFVIELSNEALIQLYQIWIKRWYDNFKKLNGKLDVESTSNNEYWLKFITAIYSWFINEN